MTQEKTPEPKGPLTQEQEELRRRAWEYHKEADMLFAARVNYSMVAQAMLVAAFATLFSSTPTGPWTKRLEIAIATFGILYTLAQFLLSISLVGRMKFLKDNFLEKFDPIYYGYMKAPPGRPKHIQSIYTPSAIAILWATFLWVALAS